jgi:hypothetical protein
LILKSDAIGEKINDPVLEPSAQKEEHLPNVKSSKNPSALNSDPNEQKNKSSQFIPILDFLKKKRGPNKFSATTKSKKAIAFRKYHDSVNLINNLSALITPKLINKHV